MKKLNYHESLIRMKDTLSELHYQHVEDEENEFPYDRAAQVLIANMAVWETFLDMDDAMIVYYYERIDKLISYFTHKIDWDGIFIIAQAIELAAHNYEMRNK